MSDKTTGRAARALGGFVLAPAISRDEAAQILQHELSENTWANIGMAFYRYGDTLDDLKASRMSKSKDPKKNSWHERQKSTIAALDAALDRLAATRKHGEFLREASENYSIATSGTSFGTHNSADLILKDAYKKILQAYLIIDRAEPQDIETPTEANARGKLVRDLRDALQSDGIPAKASDGWVLDQIDGQPSMADLTPFENLIEALCIYEWTSLHGFSKTIRMALGAEKQPKS